MSELIKIDNIVINQDDEGRYSLTDLWKASGSDKKDQPNTWLNLQSTQEGIEYLSSQDSRSLPVSTILGKGKKQGTYVCKQLVYDYAAWLSPEFKFRVYKVFDDYVNDKLKEKDWRKLRHEAAATYKIMQATLQMQREMLGKQTENKHYMCEAKLVNWALKGEFKSINREGLTINELNHLARLEEKNSVLIGHGVSYQERKNVLLAFSEQWNKLTLGNDNVQMLIKQ